ncbi:MAG TPA: CHASE2 domain-containing protein, partial [Elusimicrobiota bacterium]|nr:CHASE2 domain-containing protein [Elusimicrobiota bacterium]
MKKLFGAEALIGLTLTLLIGLLAYLQPGFTESLELKLYDLRLHLSPSAAPSDDIRMVAIDDASIEAVGRWPWARGAVAELLRRVAAGKPKVIGLDIMYVDPDAN